MPEHLLMARQLRERLLKKDELANALVIASRKMSGRSCLWTIIRGTSIGRNIWRIKSGWRPMWHGRMVKGAALRKRVQLYCRDCCAAAGVGGSCRWPTVATMVECRAMFVEAIEEIAIRVAA